MRELRDNLRHYVELVRRGHELVVTERGKPVARLVGAEAMSRREQLIAQGLITPAKRPRRRSSEIAKIKARGGLSDLLDQQKR